MVHWGLDTCRFTCAQTRLHSGSGIGSGPAVQFRAVDRASRFAASMGCCESADAAQSETIPEKAHKMQASREERERAEMQRILEKRPVNRNPSFNRPARPMPMRRG